YAGIVASAAWAHPRYVVPGAALVLVAAVPAARALLPRRLFAAAVALTLAGNLALTTRLLRPLWPDQVRVATGRLAPAEFLRRHSERFAFWERANAELPAAGLVLVLEKIPHPYYIERPFVLGSYLEQGLLDYRRLATPAAVAAAAHGLGVTHVAIDLAGHDVQLREVRHSGGERLLHPPPRRSDVRGGVELAPPLPGARHRARARLLARARLAPPHRAAGGARGDAAPRPRPPALRRPADLLPRHPPGRAALPGVQFPADRPHALRAGRHGGGASLAAGRSDRRRHRAD